MTRAKLFCALSYWFVFSNSQFFTTWDCCCFAVKISRFYFKSMKLYIYIFYQIFSLSLSYLYLGNCRRLDRSHSSVLYFTTERLKVGKRPTSRAIGQRAVTFGSFSNQQVDPQQHPFVAQLVGCLPEWKLSFVRRRLSGRERRSSEWISFRVTSFFHAIKTVSLFCSQVPRVHNMKKQQAVKILTLPIASVMGARETKVFRMQVSSHLKCWQKLQWFYTTETNVKNNCFVRRAPCHCAHQLVSATCD